MSLSQCHAEVVFELFQNGVRDTGGVLVGERAVVRAQLKAERNALLARCNAGAAVDIKQLDGAQQLAARLLDAGFEHTDGHRLVAHQRQIAADGRELGQAVVLISPDIENNILDFFAFQRSRTGFRHPHIDKIADTVRASVSSPLVYHLYPMPCHIL